MMQVLEKAGRRTGIAQPAPRSGAGIAANLSEAAYGSHRRDFFSKTRIVLKEYSGTHTRPKLLHATEA